MESSITIDTPLEVRGHRERERERGGGSAGRLRAQRHGRTAVVGQVAIPTAKRRPRRLSPLLRQKCGLLVSVIRPRKDVTTGCAPGTGTSISHTSKAADGDAYKYRDREVVD